MKMRYFLRGLGTGILLATFLLFLVYSYKMSDRKVIERAKELGMEYSREDDSEKQSAAEIPETDTGAEREENTTTSPYEPETESVKIQETSSAQEIIKVNITSGMNSEKVSEMLQMAGIIKDAEDFNKYLITNDLGRYLRTGEFEMHSDMTYEEIAALLRKN